MPERMLLVDVRNDRRSGTAFFLAGTICAALAKGTMRYSAGTSHFADHRLPGRALDARTPVRRLRRGIGGTGAKQ